MPNCPICDEKMKQEKQGDVTVDVCGGHGVWLDKKELFHITEDERHGVEASGWNDFFRTKVSPPVDHERVLGCPACKEEMKIERYEGVHIDWCKDHGVWLDSNELDAILNNLRLDESYVRGVALRLRDLRY